MSIRVHLVQCSHVELWWPLKALSMGVVESALGFQQVLDLFQIRLLGLNQSLLNPLSFFLMEKDQGCIIFWISLSSVTKLLLHTLLSVLVIFFINSGCGSTSSGVNVCIIWPVLSGNKKKCAFCHLYFKSDQTSKKDILFPKELRKS